MLCIRNGLDKAILKDYGYKKCKGQYGKVGLYYKCFARGIQVIFVSEKSFNIQKWEDNDPRIHKNANCRWRSRQTTFDEIYDLIMAGILEKRAW